MNLFIAEKKDVASSIAAALGKADETTSSFIRIGNDYVTWLSGHVLKLTDPEEHSEVYKKWSIDILPMSWPITYKPIEKHERHLKEVVDLAKKADTLVNAGDPDPEGQRLVDEVIEYAGLEKKPCKRLLINDNNTSAIQKSLSKMGDNADFKGLSMSALARGVCDMRYGYNLTRLFTILGRQSGYDDVLSVGRVQTPILGLIVARDRENAGHKKQAFYNVSAVCYFLEKEIIGQYIVKEGDPVDDKNRLNDQGFASALAGKIKGKNAVVKSVETTDKQNPAPLPYNLLALQAEAAGRWQMKPKKVLEITQALRDKYKAITYNRSDCRYLNEERHAEAPELLKALSYQFKDSTYAKLIFNTDPNVKSKAFDSSRVTAHHAIIPTLTIPDVEKLTADEARIYDLVVRSYIALFYPPETYRVTRVIFTAAENDFSVSGRVDISEGWKAVYSDNTEEEGEGTEEKLSRLNLEGMKEGDFGTVKEGRMKQVFTKPKPLYTMKTLLNDLSSVAKYVTDPRIKKLLLEKDSSKKNESGGIGTPATRDSMIDTLFQRAFIIEQGKNVISTTIGQKFHDALPGFAVKPDLTALWHEKQKDIEAGALDYQALIDEVDQTIAEEIAKYKSQKKRLGDFAQYKCPECDNNLRKLKGKKAGTFFWGCTGYPECKTTFQDENGKPQLKKTEYKCPECGNNLRKLKGKKAGTFFWGCTSYPECKTTFQDENGKPKY